MLLFLLEFKRINSCFVFSTDSTFKHVLCTFVIRGPHNKIFQRDGLGEDLSTLTVLSSAAECQLVSSNLALFSLLQCVEFVWTAASASVPLSVILRMMCELWEAWEPPYIYTHIHTHTHTILISHTHKRINNMSVWFMVAEGEWRSSVFFWGFPFVVCPCLTHNH